MEHEDQATMQGKMSDSGAPGIHVLQEKPQKQIHGDKQAPWRHQVGSLSEACLGSPLCSYSILRQPHEPKYSAYSPWSVKIVRVQPSPASQVRAEPGLEGSLLRRGSHLQTGLSKPWGCMAQLWFLPMHLLRCFVEGTKGLFHLGEIWDLPRPWNIASVLRKGKSQERDTGQGATPHSHLGKMPHIAKLVPCHQQQRWKKLASVATRCVLNRGSA